MLSRVAGSKTVFGLRKTETTNMTIKNISIASISRVEMIKASLLFWIVNTAV